MIYFIDTLLFLVSESNYKEHIVLKLNDVIDLETQDIVCDISIERFLKPVVYND